MTIYILLLFTKSNMYKMNQQYKETLTVPTQFIGQMIGRSRCNLKKVEEAVGSHCRINFCRRTQMFIITATKFAACDRSKTLLQGLLKKLKLQHQARHSRNQSSTKPSVQSSSGTKLEFLGGRPTADSTDATKNPLDTSLNHLVRFQAGSGSIRNLRHSNWNNKLFNDQIQVLYEAHKVESAANGRWHQGFMDFRDRNLPKLIAKADRIASRNKHIESTPVPTRSAFPMMSNQANMEAPAPLSGAWASNLTSVKTKVEEMPTPPPPSVRLESISHPEVTSAPKMTLLHSPTKIKGYIKRRQVDEIDEMDFWNDKDCGEDDAYNFYDDDEINLDTDYLTEKNRGRNTIGGYDHLGDDLHLGEDFDTSFWA
jgi:hypothetical protein